MEKFSSKIAFASFFIIIFILAGSSYAQNCSDYKFSNNNKYAACQSLPVLNSFLHWNYHRSNHTADIAYRHTGVTASNWIVWSLNPGGAAMIGSQCLVAFRSSTGLVRAYTSPISSYRTQLQEGPLSFNVSGIEAEFRDNEMIISATLHLPSGNTSFAHVWQYGDVSGDAPLMHSTKRENMGAFGSIDFAAGLTADTGGAASGGSRNRKRNVHGVVNVVSWGIMMPVGAMAARYLKVLKAGNPAWFYLHAACQASAYMVGVGGWATGLRLGSDSPGVERTLHRNIGITLFVLATLQALAVYMRPKPEHRYRFYWKMYHQGIGYSVIVLSIVNVFQGLDILDPGKKWKEAYVGVLMFLGAVAAVLEAFTWCVVIKRKRQSASSSDKTPQAVDGDNGYGV